MIKERIKLSSFIEYLVKNNTNTIYFSTIYGGFMINNN